jgi:LPS sulfotransferase NodH
MTKFVIFTTQRTGSTFLKNYLNSHPEITCFGELFNKPKYCLKVHQNQFYKRNHFNLFAKYKALPYLESMLIGNQAVGFKLMYNQAKEISLTPCKMRTSDIKIIHLTRENFLKIYISRQMKKKTGVSHTKRSLDKKLKISLNCEQLIESIKKIQNEVEYYNILLSKESLNIQYEHLFRDIEGETEKILNFLKIVPNGTMSCHLKKITSDALSDIIDNYDEVTSHLKNTPYEKFLW